MTDTSKTGPDYVTTKEACRRTGHALRPVTLETWRSKGVGPRFYRLGRRVVYDWNEFNAWIQSNGVGNP